MANFNSSRITRIFAQTQSAFLNFNNSGGTWSGTGAKMIRADANTLTLTRNAPYTRLPYLTGTRTELPGIRGRKDATWEIRGLPVIPSGSAGTNPDMDPILANIFGQSGSSGSYSFLDTGLAATCFSLLKFTHGSTTLTSEACWGCIVTRAVFNFNTEYITVDLTGQAGFMIDSAGFSAFDNQAQAGLSAFPIEPSSPTINGQPIAGFGNGYTCTIDSEGVQLKARALTVTVETGNELVMNVYGSPYPIAPVGNTRRISMTGTFLDDDSAALNDLKTKSDTDNVTINASIVAGVNSGSIMTFNLNNINLNAFSMKDDGATVNTDFPTSYAHGSNIGAVDDMTLVFS